MKVMICLDDHNGLLFNKRRQSLDRKVHQDMVSYVGSKVLWMNAYSYKSFAEASDNCRVDDNYWEMAKEEDFCFAEDGTIESNLHRISEIVIYRWNRVYPSDVKFRIDMLKDWNLIETVSFAGNSHEQITREVYRR